MQASTVCSEETGYERKPQKEGSKRLTPDDYSNAGILKLYDWSVKGREAHDKEMVKYRQYLMKLCKISHDVEASINHKET
ncbi:MAG: hypothetical protein ACBZ72_06315 [Candidatus Bathyarchaeia archaeon]|jgi:hypothetical protein